eukprot:Hpha_TRINITY_DN8833_c0_g1::TRINITY_DN8833_c0_g1_i2::g.141691::m.141691/K04986/PKD2; polycystin 2
MERGRMHTIPQVGSNADEALLGEERGAGCKIEEGDKTVVSVHSLHSHLRYQVEKRRGCRELPVYLLFLFVVTAVPWTTRLRNARYNELYHLEQANRVELGLGEFEQVRSRAAFWDWAENLVERVWDARYQNDMARLTSAANLPLGYLLMRQYRVQNIPCALPGVLTQDARSRIPSTCTPEWGRPHEVSTAPYGPNLSWVCSRDLERPINVESVSTSFHDYSNPEEAFPALLALKRNKTEIMREVKAMKDDLWIDQATRVVIVDIITFNPSIEAFALNHLYIEFFATGSVAAGMHAYPFELYHFDTSSRQLVFTCDIVVAFFTGLIAIQFFLSVLRRRKLGYSPPYVGMWDLYDIPFVIVHVSYCSMRFWLWSNGPALHDPIENAPTDEMDMFVSLFDYGYHYENTNTNTGVAVIFAWIRLFRYMQHHKSLGVMSLTLRRARDDIFSLGVIFTVLILGFGIGGAALYGVDHKAFSSWGDSMSYLLRLLISGEVNEHYDSMYNIQPSLTGIFITIYMATTWLLALNMVLAVLNGAFFAVQEQRRRTEQITQSSQKSVKQTVMDALATARDDLKCRRKGQDYCHIREQAMQSLRERVEQSAKQQEKDQSGLMNPLSSLSDVAKSLTASLLTGQKIGDTKLSAEDWVRGGGCVFEENYALRLFAKAKVQSEPLELDDIRREVRDGTEQLSKLIGRESEAKVKAAPSVSTSLFEAGKTNTHVTLDEVPMASSVGRRSLQFDMPPAPDEPRSPLNAGSGELSSSFGHRAASSPRAHPWPQTSLRQRPVPSPLSRNSIRAASFLQSAAAVGTPLHSTTHAKTNTQTQQAPVGVGRGGAHDGRTMVARPERKSEGNEGSLKLSEGSLRLRDNAMRQARQRARESRSEPRDGLHRLSTDLREDEPANLCPLVGSLVGMPKYTDPAERSSPTPSDRRPRGSSG